MDKLFIVTGTNRGLGKSIVQKLIKYNQKVLTITRNSDQLFTEAQSIVCDLSDEEQLQQLMNQLKKLKGYKEIVFINNAGVIEPINEIGNLGDVKDILHHIKINYLAPTCIVDTLCQLNVQLTIVNISTGAAERYLEGWSLYGSSKKAFKVILDTLQKENDCIIIKHFDPGVMDTNMQEIIRKSTFKTKDHFIAFKEQRKLRSPDDVAHYLCSELQLV